MKKLLLAFSALLLLGAGCSQPAPTTVPPTPTPQTQTITYLVGNPADNKSYCDGINMDSDGYRKTITNEKTAVIPATNDPAVLAKTIALILFPAGSGDFHEVFNTITITFKNGTITVPPIDGWAGISIGLCSVKPLLEVNFLRIPGVKQVVWQ